LKYQIEKIELFRCKKGYLKSGKLKIPFDFGIVFDSMGVIIFEISINSKFGTKRLDIGEEGDKYFDASYTAICNTLENDKLEIHKLHFKQMKSGDPSGVLVCYDKLIHTKKKRSHFEKGIKPPKNHMLHYLELEGLKMEFIDMTEEVKTRRGKKDNLPEFNRDHTITSILYKDFVYKQIFHKSDRDGQTIVTFPDQGVKNNLSYKTFLSIKLNYVYSLSLLNGAEVRVRKEYTGDYYSGNKIDSHITIIYSFKTVSNERYDYYIPLDDPFSRSSHIISTFFLKNFNKYIEWNKKIDLDSIVFYFINSIQAKSLEEVSFIQMIAFERLTTLYAEYKGQTEIFKPTKKQFEKIKLELLTILEKYKLKFGDTYNLAKSKLSNLNQVKRLSTTDKMYRILNDVNIPVTENIKLLIEQVRHKTIHRGELEKGNKKIELFYLLNELLQEIILRLIEYSGPRHSRINTSNRV